MKRKAYAGSTETLGDRQVRVICSTPSVDRAGEVVMQEGIDVDAYMQNPVVLFAHDPELPIARVVSMGIEDGNLVATVQFPPEGVAQKADEVHGLVKAGVLNTVSVGFQPTELMAMDPEQPKGPQRYVKCELLELSFVSVPANRGATVVARQHGGRPQGMVIRSLYDVGELARVMGSLGYVRDSASWEAEITEDGSKVPAMLGEALQQLGTALVAMAEEEVGELLAALELVPADTAGLPAEDVLVVEAGATAAVRKFRAGWLSLRAKTAPAIPEKVTKADPVSRDRRRRAAAVAALG